MFLFKSNIHFDKDARVFEAAVNKENPNPSY